MSRADISVLLLLALISSSAIVCNSQLSELELWRVGMIVGIGSLDNLFQFTDQPVILSPNKQFYLAVQAEPANNPNNPGNEFFCWMSVVNQSIPANKTNVWRAPCDQQLQRSNDSMQLCYFGISTEGNLLLSHAYVNGAIAFSSNTTGLGVDHAILDDSGSVLLQTAANVTVWTSATHQAPASCIGPLPLLKNGWPRLS
ncbi:hypothetical protein Mapa_009623 [Marchantia paleacea]|nr:hypothetical protein Mapa_009623 [Marchantia paleacea]